MAFGLKNELDPYYTNEWDGFVVELKFDEIAASADHDKPHKLISAEQLIKEWRIDMESSQKTLKCKTHRVARTEKSNLPSKFGTDDRMLR